MSQSQGTSQNRQNQPDQSGSGQDRKNYQKLSLRAFVIFSYFVNIIIVLALLFIFFMSIFTNLLLLMSQHPLLTMLISIGTLLFAGLYVLVTRLTKENKITQDGSLPRYPLLGHLISVTVVLTAGFYALATRLDFAALITDAIHLNFAALKANVARASIVVIPDQKLEIVENLKKADEIETNKTVLKVNVAPVGPIGKSPQKIEKAESLATGDEIEADEVKGKSAAYMRIARESSLALKEAAYSLDAQMIAAYQRIEPLFALTSHLQRVEEEFKRLEREREDYLAFIAHRINNEPGLKQRLNRLLSDQDTEGLKLVLSDLEKRLARLEKHEKENQQKEGISIWLSATNNVTSIIIAIPSIIAIIISVFTILHR